MTLSARRLLTALLVGAAALLLAPPADASLARPTSFRLAAGGQHNTGLRVQWGWRSGVAYEIQVARNSSFTEDTRTVRVAGRTSRPSGGVLAVSVSDLANATRYAMRVRAVQGSTRSSWSSALSASTKVGWPSRFTSVSAKAGPRAGEITVSWKHDGTYTTGYEMETALTLFSKTPGSAMPRVGRHSRVFAIPAGVRSYTLTAAQVAEAGAAGGSGTHLLYRFAAVNRGTAGTQIRRYPYLRALMPDAPETYTSSGAPRSGTSELRAVSFNVRTARATSDARSWLQRRADVAEEILDAHPDVAALQELGPGRADGQTGSTTGSLRQTTSLQETLADRGGARYRLVRTTPYVAPGVVHGSQGARLLYNSSTVELLSECPDATGRSNYSPSCSINLPLLDDDSESRRRRAAVARFRLKSTGAQFWMVSAHLDERHSPNATTEEGYNALRGRQMRAVLARVAELNTTDLPVVVAGDLNSWQNNRVGHAPHDTLVDAGFFDTASAPRRVNLKYSTYNDFAVTQTPSGVGFGSRLDEILVSRGTALNFENVTQVTDSTRPSDHNLVLADLVLGR